MTATQKELAHTHTRTHTDSHIICHTNNGPL